MYVKYKKKYNKHKRKFCLPPTEQRHSTLNRPQRCLARRRDVRLVLSVASEKSRELYFIPIINVKPFVAAAVALPASFSSAGIKTENETGSCDPASPRSLRCGTSFGLGRDRPQEVSGAVLSQGGGPWFTWMKALRSPACHHLRKEQGWATGRCRQRIAEVFHTQNSQNIQSSQLSILNPVKGKCDNVPSLSDAS